jgi:prepilin-type N-terminal cleavage/methylation domain-containing protein
MYRSDKKGIMCKAMGRNGFSLIELLIVTALLAVVVVMSSDTFSLILRQSREQTRISGTQVETLIGLEFLRRDVEKAGFGLFWSFPLGVGPTIAYNEAVGATATPYNDATSGAGGIPRAIVSGNNVSAMLNSSDYIAIKATSVADNDVALKWTYLIGGQAPTTWSAGSFVTGEQVIVMKPNVDQVVTRRLIMSGTAFYTAYTSAAAFNGFAPLNANERYIIYGLAPSTTTPRMPFNRVDYYVKRPSTNMPSACAPGTGILYRATVNQSDGSLSEMPLLDCVADMQLVYRLDTTGSGTINSSRDDLTSPLLSAAQIANQLKEVRVYILLHEGERDNAYQYPSSTIAVGGYGCGRAFSLPTLIGSNWSHYRWKVYTLVIRPRSLLG